MCDNLEIPPWHPTAPVKDIEPVWNIYMSDDPHSWKIGQSIGHLRSENWERSLVGDGRSKGEWTLYLDDDNQIAVVADPPTSMQALVEDVFPKSWISQDGTMTLPELLSALSKRKREPSVKLNEEARRLIELVDRLAEHECVRILKRKEFERNPDWWRTYENFMVLYVRSCKEGRVISRMSAVKKDGSKKSFPVCVWLDIVRVYHHRGLNTIELDLQAIGASTSTQWSINGDDLDDQEIWFSEQWHFPEGLLL